MDVSSHEDSAGEFCCAGSIFSVMLLGFVSKAIKLLLTELVGQCRNILPLGITALTSNSANDMLLLTEREVHTRKYLFWRSRRMEQIFPVWTKISVNKSFIVHPYK